MWMTKKNLNNKKNKESKWQNTKLYLKSPIKRKIKKIWYKLISSHVRDKITKKVLIINMKEGRERFFKEGDRKLLMNYDKKKKKRH